MTECQDNGVIYLHQQEITGYQRHDDKLFAYRLVTVYIEGVETLTGRYNVLTSQVLPGDPQIPYSYVGKGPAVNGETFYEECTRFDERDEVETYKRPDDTTHKVIVGDATPLNLGDKCNLEVTWSDVTQWYWQNPGVYTNTNYCGISIAGGTQGSDDSPWTQAASNHCTWSSAVGTKKLVRRLATLRQPPVKQVQTLTQRLQALLPDKGAIGATSPLAAITGLTRLTTTL